MTVHQRKIVYAQEVDFFFNKMFTQNKENIIQISFNSQHNANTHKKQYFKINFIVVILLFNIENRF